MIKPERSKGSRKRRLIVVIAVVILAGLGYWFLVRDTSPAEDSVDTRLLQIQQVSRAEDVAAEYSQDYTASTQEITKATRSSWDKTTVDKAYFTLIYADKVGAYAQVRNTLFLLESAQRSGVNIDDNSYGIDQKSRDVFRQRADANSRKTKEVQGE